MIARGAGAQRTDGERTWLRKYPDGVPPHLVIPDLLLTDLVSESVRKWGDRTALFYYGARWTYRRLWEDSGRFAAALLREGLAAGDRVALYLPNCPLYPIALLGTWRLGAIAVQVSPLYHHQDLVPILDDAAPKAIVTLEILYPRLEEVRAEHAVPVEFVARLRDSYPWSSRPFVNSVLRRRGLPTRFPDGPSVRSVRRALRTPGSVPKADGDPSTAVAVLQYTGGTTGTPKAAMLSHRNLVANVLQADAWNTTREPGREVMLASVPFFHVYGLTIALLLGLAEGATIVIQTRPEIRELLRLIDRHRPTQFPGVPALYQSFVQQPDLAKYRLRSIKFCLSGSAPLPGEVQRQFELTTGGNLVEGYGLTEASPATHANPVKGERRAGSIGLPLPETDQRVVDPENGSRALGMGEVGELSIRGPQVMLGYFGRPEETARVLRDGWLLTGDLARLDADGYAFIVERKKDLIIVGGLNVYPREVEEVLFQHPGVADAAVIGVPDAVHGELPQAFVVRKPGAAPSEQELIDFVRDRIAHYKAPRSVRFRDSLPRSAVQKVLRRTLREEATAAPPEPR